MNIPGITRALELDDADWDLAVKLRGLTDHQREQFSVALGPAKPSKKSSKKSVGRGGGKSKHASSLQQQIQTARPSLDGGVSKMRCAAKNCGEYADNNVHHKRTDPDYHPFVSTAQPAESSSNQATSEIGRGVVSNAHHAASSGD